MNKNQKVSDQNDEEKFKIEDCQDISDNEQIELGNTD